MSTNPLADLFGFQDQRLLGGVVVTLEQIGPRWKVGEQFRDPMTGDSRANNQHFDDQQRAMLAFCQALESSAAKMRHAIEIGIETQHPEENDANSLGQL